MSSIILCIDSNENSFYFLLPNIYRVQCTHIFMLQFCDENITLNVFLRSITTDFYSTSECRPTISAMNRRLNSLSGGTRSNNGNTLCSSGMKTLDVLLGNFLKTFHDNLFLRNVIIYKHLYCVEKMTYCDWNVSNRYRSTLRKTSVFVKLVFNACSAFVIIRNTKII